jgi:hypothetical protein
MLDARNAYTLMALDDLHLRISRIHFSTGSNVALIIIIIIMLDAMNALVFFNIVGWDYVQYVLRSHLAYCTSPRWQTRVIVDQLVEQRLAGETEVLGENLPQHWWERQYYEDLGVGRTILRLISSDLKSYGIGWHGLDIPDSPGG